MKQIIIKQEKDFEQLRNLNKTEYIVLKIDKDLETATFSIIDLQGFKGTIDIMIDNPKTRRKFIIQTKDLKGNYLFFKNYQKCQIIYPNQSKIIMDYQVGSKKETLNHDIVLTTPPSDELWFIDGKKHIVYGTEEILQTWNSPDIVWKNVQFCKIDIAICIDDWKQLEQIKNYKGKKIAVSLTKNLKNKKIMPINLEDFYGTLIFLGNNHCLSNIKLENNPESSIGLISAISNQANISCSDLNIAKLEFPDSDKEVVGTLIGKIITYPKIYQSCPGQMIFKNCHIFQTKMVSGSKYTGVLIGEAPQDTECFRCTAKINLGHHNHKLLGNQNFYTPEDLEYTKLSNSEYKRILIPAQKRNGK